MLLGEQSCSLGAPSTADTDGAGLRAQRLNLAIYPGSARPHTARTEALIMGRLYAPVIHRGTVPADRQEDHGPMLSAICSTDT